MAYSDSPDLAVQVAVENTLGYAAAAATAAAERPGQSKPLAAV